MRLMNRHIGAMAVACIAAVSLVSVCRADVLVSQNLGASAYSASGTLGPGFEPELAFDGVVGESGWNAGDFPVQWLEVDLQQPYYLTSLRLDVDQNPDGDTSHQVWISDSAIHGDLSGATLIHTFSGFTAYQDVLTHAPPAPEAAQFVQIRTIDSPSWVGWLEVQVRAVPEPTTIGLAAAEILGLAFVGRRKK
jgi:hypothetical protein